MSTRYVWSKYQLSYKEVSLKTDINLSILGDFSDYIFCSQIPQKNSFGQYVASGSTKNLSDVANEYGSTLGFTVEQYPYIVKANQSYYYEIGSAYPSNTEYFLDTPWENPTIKGWNISQEWKTSITVFEKTAQVISGDFVSYVSSSIISEYPKNTSGEEYNGYFYKYLGSDNIDPTAISYKKVANVGDSVTLTITKSSSISYGGTITYIIDRSVNNGAWEQWSSKTSITSGVTVNSSGTREFRVHAKDNYGFESTTYVTGPLLTVVGNSTISVTASPTAGGSVSGSGTYASGSSVTVTASPSNGYRFSYWLEGSTQVSTSANYTFTASGDRTLIASFTQSTTYYTVTVTASPTAGGTVSSGGSYESGSSVTIIATANSGYNFSGWYESNILMSSATAYTFTITANRTLQARFSTQSTFDTTITRHGAFIGGSNVARKVKNTCIGVDNVARKVKTGYIGVNNVARLFYLYQPLTQRLPEGYTELEYIYSNGNQYIDTGIRPYIDSINGGSKKLLLKAQLIVGSTGWATTSIIESYISANISGMYQSWVFSLSARENKEILCSIGDGNSVAIASGYTGIFTVSMEISGKCSFNGIQYNTGGNLNNQNYAYRMPSIKIRGTNLGSNPVNLKIFSCQMYGEEDKLLGDFVPCKNNSGVVGLYDFVSNSLFSSASNSSFLPGPSF